MLRLRLFGIASDSAGQCRAVPFPQISWFSSTTSGTARAAWDLRAGTARRWTACSGALLQVGCLSAAARLGLPRPLSHPLALVCLFVADKPRLTVSTHSPQVKFDSKLTAPFRMHAHGVRRVEPRCARTGRALSTVLRSAMRCDADRSVFDPLSKAFPDHWIQSMESGNFSVMVHSCPNAEAMVRASE